jgi:hypothetical protein
MADYAMSFDRLDKRELGDVAPAAVDRSPPF